MWHYKCIRPILNGHTWPNFLCPNCRAVADLEADVEEDNVDWSEDEDDDKDPDVRKAIEESLRDSGSKNGERTNGDGEAVRSLDVTDARGDVPSTGTMLPSLTLDAVAGAHSSTDTIRGRTGYGQGSNEDIRTPRPQRSFHSAVSSLSARDRDTSRAASDASRDAELAALVSGMNFSAAPARTPPPPPVSAAKPSTASANSSALRLPSAAGIRSTRAGSVPPVSSPVTPGVHDGGDGSPEDQDESDEDEDSTRADIGAERGIAITAGPSSRPRMSRNNTPSALRKQGDGEAEKEIGGPDCPMTPRNDAGPFILDGSGNR